jgi:hypothetical protein
MLKYDTSVVFGIGGFSRRRRVTPNGVTSLDYFAAASCLNFS